MATDYIRNPNTGRAIKENVWGNWYGYESGRRVMAFGNLPEATAEQAARAWLTTGPSGIQVPIVHLNGTGERQLGDSLERAWRQVQAAIRAVVEAAPHQRDYYPLGDLAWQRAVAQHADRIARLARVERELQRLVESVIEKDV